MGLGGWCPVPVPSWVFFRAWGDVSYPRASYSGIGEQEEESGEQPVGGWDLGLPLVPLGKKPLVSRVRFDDSSLVLSSPYWLEARLRRGLSDTQHCHWTSAHSGRHAPETGSPDPICP